MNQQENLEQEREEGDDEGDAEGGAEGDDVEEWDKDELAFLAGDVSSILDLAAGAAATSAAAATPDQFLSKIK